MEPEGAVTLAGQLALVVAAPNEGGARLQAGRSLIGCGAVMLWASISW